MVRRLEGQTRRSHDQADPGERRALGEELDHEDRERARIEQVRDPEEDD